MAVELLPRSIEVDGLLMGRGTPYKITKIIAGGKPDAEIRDRQRPRQDSLAFGRDNLTGRLLKIELTIDTDSYLACQQAWAELSTVWDAERIRVTPGSVIPMRVRQFTGDTRWVVGRPNLIDPVDEDLMNLGRLDVVMDFRCIDHKFYSDTEYSTTVSIIPASSGGFSFPLRFPVSTYGRGEGEGIMSVGGDTSTWVTSIVHGGPITRPEIEIAQQWRAPLNTIIYDQEYIHIDPSPWAQTVRRNGVSSEPGIFTQEAPYLTQMTVAPGNWDLVLRGTDPTGTSILTTSWRNAFLTL